MHKIDRKTQRDRDTHREKEGGRYRVKDREERKKAGGVRGSDRGGKRERKTLVANPLIGGNLRVMSQIHQALNID